MSTPLTVGQLERALLARFPASDAEEWDRTGMLVGDAAAPVTGVAVALDPTVDAICQTAERGANVLVTHHPLFLDPPTSIAPPAQRGNAVGARVWEAVARGVSVLSFHTALDVSLAGSAVLPRLLGLEPTGVLEVVRRDPDRGYGRIGAPADAATVTLGRLAERCRAALAHPPRVWGPEDAPLSRIAVCTGAAGDALERVRRGLGCRRGRRSALSCSARCRFAGIMRDRARARHQRVSADLRSGIILTEDRNRIGIPLPARARG